jgi:hypothetical protein
MLSNLQLQLVRCGILLQVLRFLFLRACTVAPQQGDELKGLAKGFAEPKKGQALKLIDGIRADTKAADKPASAGSRDKAAFAPFQRSIQTKLDDLIGLFQDVPDEL